jgi:hypothetical protein
MQYFSGAAVRRAADRPFFSIQKINVVVPRKNVVKRLSDEAIGAVHRQDYSLLNELVTASTVDLTNKQGRSLLSYIVLYGDVPMLDWVLARQPALDLADHNGWTPLHFAAQAYAVEVAEKLLGAGATVDQQDAYGNTPLWRAVFDSRNRGAMILLLLLHGADAARKNHSGISPLELAHTIANFEVKQFFPH